MADGDNPFETLFQDLPAYGGLDQMLSTGAATPGPVSGSTFDLPPATTVNPNWAGAMRMIESGSAAGNYASVTPSGRGFDVLGAYQISERNLPEWSRRWVGREVSRAEFLANPALQDRIFEGQFGDVAARLGPQRAAELWLGTGGSDRFGTTPQAHGVRFMSALAHLERGGGGPGPGTGPRTGMPGYEGLLQPVPRPAARQGSITGLIDRIMGAPTERQLMIQADNYQRAAQVEAALATRPPQVSPERWQRAVTLLQRSWRNAQEMFPNNPHAMSRTLMNSNEFSEAIGIVGGSNIQNMLRVIAAMQQGLDPLSGLTPGPVGTNPTAQDFARTATHPNLPENLRPGMMARGLGPTPEAFSLGQDQDRYEPVPGTNPVQYRRVAAGRGPENTQRVQHATRMLETITTEGQIGNRALADLQALEGAFDRIERRGEWNTGLHGLARQWGISLGPNASDIDLAQAIAGRLAPQMRVPGTGPLSNFETQSLLQSIPSVWQTPEGRRLVIRQLRAMSEYQAERGQIASEFFSGTASLDTTMGRLQQRDREFAELLKSLRESLSPGGWTPAPGGGRWRREP